MNGREISRTPHYMVLSRERGQSLWQHLFALHHRRLKLEKIVDELRDEKEEQRLMLVHALHQLALATDAKEPQLFIRQWLATQRGLIAEGERR